MLLQYLVPFTLLMALTAPTTGAEHSRVLMVTESKGFLHGSVRRPKESLSPSEVAMIQLGDETRLFTVDCTQDSAADLAKDNLQNYDIVMFYTSGHLPVEEDNLNYFFQTWLKQDGHGFIGIHSAADTFKNYEPYWDMVGGTFNGHPWGAGNTVTITVHEPDHPVMKPFGTEFTIREEIYQYRNWQPEKVRVLMSLNMEQCQPKRPWHVPVAWVKRYGEGRIYYNNLGHNVETWTNRAFLESIAAGVRWIRGDLSGASKPNPELSEQEELKAQQAVRQRTAGAKKNPAVTEE